MIDSLDLTEIDHSQPRCIVPLYKLRMVRDGNPVLEPPVVVTSPKVVANVVAACVEGAIGEHLLVVVLNTDNVILGVLTVSIGNIKETIADPGDILTPVLVARAPAFILAHNHPSGNPTPSRDDLALFKHVKAAAEIMHRNLVDCIITGSDGKYYSWLESAPYEVMKKSPDWRKV